MGIPLFFRAVALEEFDDTLVVLVGCQAQRPVPVTVPCIDLGPLSDQQLNHGGLTIISCHVQRRVAVVVCRFERPLIAAWCSGVLPSLSFS